jgi:SagB-type dehydrogenase family enzyme
VRASATKPRRSARAPTLFARLASRVTLALDPNGRATGFVDGHAVALGTLSAAVAARAGDFRTGLPLAVLTSGRSAAERELSGLGRRLAAHGLLEYALGRVPGDDLLVIEPQVAGYWPQVPRLRKRAILVLSRFAYLRRRDDAMVLESPRSGAAIRICDPQIAALLAQLATPQRLDDLVRRDGFPGAGLLGLMVACSLLLELQSAADGDLRSKEGDGALVLWDFHDLLFHTRSTEGRQADAVGGFYAHADAVPPLPAVRPRWPGKKVALDKFPPVPAESAARLANLLRQRHSSRSFDERRPITVSELAQFLGNTARVLSRFRHRMDVGITGPMVEYAMRPYPSGGASYPLEIYLAVDACEGLARGFYHYDAGAHALVPIASRADALQALLREAALAMDAPALPPILITIAARFGRVSWKYSGLAYALILKDVGVLTQTFYLMATGMGLGGCAIGSIDIDLFARMTGIEFHQEGPVGHFALGREAPDELPVDRA